MLIMTKVEEIHKKRYVELKKFWEEVKLDLVESWAQEDKIIAWLRNIDETEQNNLIEKIVGQMKKVKVRKLEISINV